jgi:copper chaperone
METAILNIKGMTCMGCINSITRVLKAVAGVNEVRVTLEPAQAIVKYDATLTNLAQLKHAIEDAGYDAE